MNNDRQNGEVEDAVKVAPSAWLRSIALSLDEEGRATAQLAKRSPDFRKRHLLPRASACYGAAMLLRQIVDRRAEAG